MYRITVAEIEKNFLTSVKVKVDIEAVKLIKLNAEAEVMTFYNLEVEVRAPYAEAEVKTDRS